MIEAVCHRALRRSARRSLASGAVLALGVAAALLTPRPACASEAPADDGRPGYSIRIVAIVNDVPITSYELESVCRLRKDFRDLKRQNPGDPQLDLMRKRVLQLMIDEKLLIRVAESEGLKWTPADEVDLQRALLRKAENHGSVEALDDSLRKLDVKPEFLRDRLKVDIILGKLFLAKISKNIFVRPEEMQKHYDEHKGEFYQPALLRVRQLYIAFGNQKDDARARIEKARARVVAGEDFDAVVRELSEVRAEEGGLYEFEGTLRAEMIPPVGEQAGRLPVGELSEVLESRKGFHLIRVEERRRKSLRTFEEVQEQIQDTLRRQAWDKRLELMIEEEREKATIRLLE